MICINSIVSYTSFVIQYYKFNIITKQRDGYENNKRHGLHF